MQVYLCHNTLVSAGYFNFQVCDYIKYGWDILLIDPDDGVNVKCNLQATAKYKDSFDDALFLSIPPAKDAHWTKALYKPLRLNLELSTDF